MLVVSRSGSRRRIGSRRLACAHGFCDEYPKPMLRREVRGVALWWRFASPASSAAGAMQGAVGIASMLRELKFAESAERGLSERRLHDGAACAALGRESARAHDERPGRVRRD